MHLMNYGYFDSGKNPNTPMSPMPGSVGYADVTLTTSKDSGMQYMVIFLVNIWILSPPFAEKIQQSVEEGNQERKALSYTMGVTFTMTYN